MLYLNTFLYYTVFASSILVYGVGLSKTQELGILKLPEILFFLKAIASIYFTAILSWLVTAKILVPLQITDIFPLIIFLILISISSFIECLVRLTTNNTATEFIISYLIVFLSISESTSCLQSIIVCSAAICSIIIIVPFIVSLIHRLSSNGCKINEKFYSIVFIFLSVILLCFSVFDISWMNGGVLK